MNQTIYGTHNRERINKLSFVMFLSFLYCIFSTVQGNMDITCKSILTSPDRVHDIFIVFIAFTILILIKVSSLKFILSVLIIAIMDKFETIKSIGAPLNHCLLMNLPYLASYLLNQRILTCKDFGKRKIYLLIPEEISHKPNQLKSLASIMILGQVFPKI